MSGDWRNANPDDLEELANRLWTQGDGGAYGALSDIFNRARSLDAWSEVSSLLPLHTWMIDAAQQLRDAADTLRRDDDGDGRADRPSYVNMSPYDLMQGHHLDEDSMTLEAWAIPGQEDADAFVALARDDDLTEQDLTELHGYLDGFGDNPDFAGYVVDELGMAQYLRLSQRVDALAAHTAGPQAANDLQRSLGTLLTRAFWTPGEMGEETPTTPAYQDSAYRDWLRNTPQGQRYQERLAAFQALGDERPLYLEETSQSADPDIRWPYDVAMDLLDQSAVPVDDRFFHQTMHHLIEMERANPQLWATSRHDPDTPGHWHPHNDITDRLLGIGARNPTAVAAFFDPQSTTNLDYFLGNGESARNVHPDTRALANPTGLSLAIEAAATGIVPGQQPDAAYAGHSAANIRIAQVTWNTFARNRSRIEEDGDAEHLRYTLGTIASDYIADIQPAVQPRSGHAEANFDRVGTAMLLWELGTEPGNYERISAANNVYTQMEIEQAIAANSGNRNDLLRCAEDAASSGGYVSGILADASTTAGYEAELEAQAGHNDAVGQAQTYTDLLVQQAIARIPHPATIAVGEVVAPLIIDMTFEQFKVDREEESRNNAQDRYSRSLNEWSVGTSRAARQTYGEFDNTGVPWEDLSRAIDKGSVIGFDGGIDRRWTPN